jgi:hypothetical protein
MEITVTDEKLTRSSTTLTLINFDGLVVMLSVNSGDEDRLPDDERDC